MNQRPQPNTKSLRVKWAIAAGAVLLLLFSIGLLSYRRLNQEDAAQKWVMGLSIGALAWSQRPISPKRAEDALKQSEERFRMNTSSIKDYSVITLGPEGLVTTWKGAAERITGYTAFGLLGKPVSIFYTPKDVAIGKPTTKLETAMKSGRFEDDGWRVRKDGSRFWANAVVTPLQDPAGRARGFVKITRDTTEKRKAEQELIGQSAELEAANKELESFSYSVSHDLRYGLGANSFVRNPVEFDKFIEVVRQLGLCWLILIEAATVARRS